MAKKLNFWPDFMGSKVGFHGFSWVLWVLCVQTVDQVTNRIDGHHPAPISVRLGPKSGFSDLKWQKNSIFGPILWVLWWVFMGFMGFMCTDCG